MMRTIPILLFAVMANALPVRLVAQGGAGAQRSETALTGYEYAGLVYADGDPALLTFIRADGSQESALWTSPAVARQFLTKLSVSGTPAPWTGGVEAFFLAVMNTLGSDRWELVTVTTLPGGTASSPETMITFRRPRLGR